MECTVIVSKEQLYTTSKDLSATTIQGSSHPNGHSLGVGPSCFCEVFCPGSNLLTTSFPVKPVHPSSSEDERMREHLESICDHKLSLKGSELWSPMELFFIPSLLSNSSFGDLKNRTGCFSFIHKRKATHRGSFIGQKADADLSSLP